MTKRRLNPLIAAAPLMLAGCMVGPRFAAPHVDPPAAWGDERTDVASRTFGGAVDTLWWRSFNDVELNGLVDRLAAQNIDLKTAAERVVQARAQRRVAAASILPSIDATPGYSRQRLSANGTITNTLPSPTSQLEFNEYKPQLSVSWEIDLFGGISRSVEAAEATTQAQIEDRRGIALSAIAELAQDYFQLRQVQAEERLLRRNIDAVRKRSELLRQQVRLGAASALDLTQNDAQLSTIQQGLPGLLASEARLVNAVGFLLAEPPRTLDAELASTAGTQPLIPPAIPVGLPSDLARRRPDVRKAEANLHAATAQTGVAVASFYPSLSLTGSAGYDSLHAGNLFDFASRFFTVAPVLSLPIFHGGELRGTLALRQSQQREAALSYRKTVIQAWHDVDNALTAYAQAQASLKDAVATDATNARALALALQRYRAGATDYLSVIAAQTAVYGGETGVTQAQLQIETSLATLYKALGGGWEALPAPVATGG